MSVVLTEAPVFTIKPNALYRISEKVDTATPQGLKEKGRYKMVANTEEPARCKWVGDPSNGNYDTGFDTSSSDFYGKEKGEVTKILKERETLKKHYEARRDSYLKANGSKTETDFLASENCGIQLKHGEIVDTKSIDNYLKLYFAFRSGQITPSIDKSNPNYNSSLFVITEISSTQDDTVSKFDKQAQVFTWYSKNKADNFDKVVKTLQYAEILPYGRAATDTVITGHLEKTINDITKLDNLIRIIETVEDNVIFLHVKVEQLNKKQVIKKEDNNYHYKDVPLGRSIQQVVTTLLEGKHDSILDQIMAEK